MELRMRPFEGDAERWDSCVARLPQAHLLQTWKWAQIKAQYGWHPIPMIWRPAAAESSTEDKTSPRAMAMVLKRQLGVRGIAAPLSVMYVPKGPLLAWPDASVRRTVLADLEALCRSAGAIFVKIDPDIPMPAKSTRQASRGDASEDHDAADELLRRGWRCSDEQIQFRNTVVLDVSAPEEALLGGMKQKTRYNIRLASKKGVRLRMGAAEDLPSLYRIYAETSRRDGFAIRDQRYYEHVWGAFLGAPVTRDVPGAECLIAEVDKEIAAAIFVFFFADRAYYLYGMSRAEHREKMPNHLLQWEAIRLAKRRGCRIYDFWGAPDELNERDRLWGVYRFKEGFGGEVVRTPGAWDFPARRAAYLLYTRAVPPVLGLMRWAGRRRVQQDLLGA